MWHRGLNARTRQSATLTFPPDIAIMAAVTADREWQGLGIEELVVNVIR